MKLSASTSTPYTGTPAPTGSRIEAENFDNGGQGITWNDSDTGNKGGKYRSNVDVDIYSTSGGHKVGRVFAGEWLNYTINVASTGTYDVTAIVSSPASGGKFRIEIGGQNISGSVNMLNTGSWNNFQTIVIEGVNLSAGTKIMKVVMEVNGSNGYTGDFDAFRIDPVSVLPPPPVETGLAAHWKLDESSGNTTSDSAGSHNGFLQNGPEWSPGNGAVGGSLKFDGNNDRVEVRSFNISGQKLSLSAWIKKDGSGHVEGRMISKASSTSGGDHVWMLSMIETNKLRFRLNSGGTVRTLVAQTAVSANTWHHTAATYDGSQMKIFLNGNQIASMAASGNIASSSANIGLGNQPNGAGERPFGGELDEIKIYEKALTAQEINSLSSATSMASFSSFSAQSAEPDSEAVLQGIGESMISFWNFNEASGSEARDSIGGNNGELVNNLESVQLDNGNIALKFNGTNYVAIPSSASLNFTNKLFSVMCLVNPESINGKQTLVSMNSPFEITLNQGYPDVLVTSEGGSELLLQSEEILSTQKYYQLTVTYDSETVKLYVNGALKASLVSDQLADSQGLDMNFASSSNGTQYFKGILDSISILNKAMTQNEIDCS